MDEIERAEAMILRLKLDKPLCNVVLQGPDARVVLEQGLELTWGGDVEKCRELVKFFFPPELKPPRPNNEFFLRNKPEESLQDGIYTLVATDGTYKATFTVRGDNRQPMYLMAAFMAKGGIDYFDGSVKDRGDNL